MSGLPGPADRHRPEADRLRCVLHNSSPAALGTTPLGRRSRDFVATVGSLMIGAGNDAEWQCLSNPLRPVAHWLDALSAAGVPCAAIQSLDQVLVHPQLASRQLMLETDHPVLGPMPQKGSPVAFNGAPRNGQRPPLLHGQHTSEILRALGYGNEAIAALASQGAIHTLSEAEVPA